MLTPLRPLIPLTLCLGLAACGGGDDDDDDDSTGTTDADITGSGDDIDAATPDATPQPDATPAPVTVSVIAADGTAVPGAKVFFNGPDGSVISLVTTGVDGKASELVPAGGMASVLAPSPAAGLPTADVTLFTWTGVMPGDQLEVHEPAAVRASTTLELTLPAPVGGATYYEVQAGCTTNSWPSPPTPVTLSIEARCLNPDGTFDIRARATDATGMVAYATVTGVTPVDGGTTSVTVPSWQTTDIGTFSVDLLNFPVDGSEPAITTTALRGPVPFDIPWRTSFATTTLTISADTAGTFAERLGVRVYVLGGPSPAVAPALALPGTSGVLTTYTPPATGATIDWATAFPPVIVSTEVTTPASGRPTLTYTADGDLSAMTGGLAHLSWTAAASSGEWLVLVPADAGTAFEVPALPDALSSVGPPSDATYGSSDVILFGGDAIADYDALRAGNAFARVLDQSAWWPPADTTLTVSMSSGVR